MLVKGSTAPDHYIPYQQGVGERTENLAEAKIANTNINDRGQITSNQSYATRVAPIKQGVTYTYTTDDAVPVYAEYTEYPVLGSVAYNSTRVIRTTTFTATIDGYIAFRTSPNYATAMCVVGSTAPTTYIPYGYQIPISTQGKNLFDSTNLVTDPYYHTYYTSGGQTGNAAGWTRTINAIPVLPSTEYTFEPNSSAGISAKHLYLDADKNFISAIDSGGSTFTTPSNCYYMQFSLRTSSTNVMLVKDSTTPQTYIPYFRNDYTFYIGSSPLTTGQSISKSSTGVDIETQVGENTIDTTLYNKPVMEIEYE